VMEPGAILAAARCAAGLSQEELAERAGTSRPTLSAYEHGHLSPTLRTAVRILVAAGFELIATQLITFQEVTIGSGAGGAGAVAAAAYGAGSGAGARDVAAASELVTAWPRVRSR
jgi:transcriptional regulator with XRE-family HTH domain